MKKKLNLPALAITITMSSFLMLACNSDRTSQDKSSPATDTVSANQYGGFSSQVAWGQHLVSIGGCNDCHTPKIMTNMGPVPDTAMYLAGHPANVPAPQVNRTEIESKGLIVTNDLSVWIGPWGISYAANLTPDTTGTGGWSEAQFLRVFRGGKAKGIEGNRLLLPPMSFVAEGLNHAASDEELKAVFAYLKSVKPVDNVVPAPIPPVTAGGH
jgi:hypothetical protein